MWTNVVFVGATMATGTLLVLDASLPGGLIEGTGDIRYAQTMAFTTIVFFSLFTVFNARSDERSAFVGLFSNAWLWAAVSVSVLLQAAVVHVPFLQAGVLDGCIERARLAYVRGRWELRPLVVREQEAAHAGAARAALKSNPTQGTSRARAA